MFSDFENAQVATFKVDDYLSGGLNSYDNFISDHTPVYMRLNFSDQDVGDINSDGVLDILDVIEIINTLLIFVELNCTMQHELEWYCTTQHALEWHCTKQHALQRQGTELYWTCT